MIRITLKQLRDMGACRGGIEWFKKQRSRTLKRIIPSLLKDNKSDYAFWLLSRLMTRSQKVPFAIFAAEQVLDIFERRRPGDDRPRQAIQAAKDFLAGKISAYAANAAYAAYAAVNAYAAYADDYAAYAAANAAYAAYAAAYAAVNANADAYATVNAAYAANAYAAANAAANVDAANAAYGARRAIQERIAIYGLELLEEGGKSNGK